jgi:K+-transporting ATPase KdpF subunit
VFAWPFEARHCEEHCHDRPRHAGDRFRLVRVVDQLRLRLRFALKAAAMIFDYSLAGVVTLGLLVYLTYALLRPERF